MMFPIKFPAALLFFALSMSASPVLSSQHMAQRGDDWSATFDYPQPGAYLCAGRNMDVVWETSNVPGSLQNSDGTLVLYDATGSGPTWTLGQVPLKQGQFTATVPQASPGDHYLIGFYNYPGHTGEFHIEVCVD